MKKKASVMELNFKLLTFCPRKSFKDFPGEKNGEWKLCFIHFLTKVFREFMSYSVPMMLLNRILLELWLMDGLYFRLNTIFRFRGKLQ